MPPHACTKEKDIDRLSKAVFGNGEDGLVQNVATILEKTSGIEQTLEGLKTGVSGLLKFQTAVMTEKDLLEKRRLSGWNITMILGTLFLSLGSIITAIIIKS